ncbi:MAG: type VI secretion system Vgr family protein [Cellvibrionaceae bacterium]
MPDGHTQAKRNIRLNTSLGPLALIPETLECNQMMSSGFSISVKAFSESLHELDPKDLVGTAATVGIVQADNSLLYLNGFVQQFSALGSSRAGEATQYAIKIVSWLEMFLSKRTDCRIFQSKKVDDVISDIFKQYGADASFKIDIKSPRAVKRYWVQYNETDLAFFKRLCLLEGLAFYFGHENGSHTLHIVDSAEFLADLAPKKVRLQSHSSSHEHLTNWQTSGRFASGKFEQRAYNYKTPSAPVVVNNTVSTPVSETPRVLEMESYVYGDSHHSNGDGKSHVAARANKSVERAQVWTGRGDCRNLSVGKHFELELADGSWFFGGQFKDKGKTFTLTKVNLSANNDTGSVACSIEAVPQGELVYPNAKFPTINGLQTAVVTGPKGEEIHMDPEGRIKVQFHWDRQGKQDENTTCWLRVMQSFAGPNFGSQFTPRIGQEVVVAFENGNPDRPFVIGALYHPENPPPYKDHKGTRNGIRTRSTKGGGTANCNELYFEDTKGSEEVYFQAEKDHNALVKNDQQIKIGHNKAQQVVKNETNKVGENYTINVGKKLLIEAGQEIKLQVGGSTITITGSKIDISAGVVDINGAIKLN